VRGRNLLTDEGMAMLLVDSPPGRRGMVLGPSEWAAHHFAAVELGDRRRTQRAVAVAAQLAAHPDASLPAQTGDRAALRGAYGLLNNQAVRLDALLAPSIRQTLEAARREEVVLLGEDTTELDYTAHPKTKGVGPIGDGKGRGLLLHSTLAVRPSDRQVLGLAHAQVVLRQPSPAKHTHWVASPEALVWETSARAIGSPPPGVRWVHVGDRGSDDFGFLVACTDLRKDVVVRLFHNRVLAWDEESPQAADPTAHLLLDYLRTFPPVPEVGYPVHIPAHPVKGKLVPARDAHVGLAWAKVTIPPPQQAPEPLRSHAPLVAWAVRVWETDPPPDVAEPVEWLLLTSLPITSIPDAHRIVDYYTCRWLCEDYHQCLKTGCRVENSQLDDGADLRRLLGFAIPLAVRLLQLRQAVRHLPDLPAVALIEPLQVEILARRRHLDALTLTVTQFWQAVARLGGHQGRKSDGPPGWRTLWKGYCYLCDITEGARLAWEKGPP